MSEQNNTPQQAEEVAAPASAVDAQPEPAVEAPVANDKVSEQQSSEAEEKKPDAGESKDASEAESKKETAEPVVESEKPAEGSEPTEKVESSEAEAAVDKTADAGKVVEAVKSTDATNGEAAAHTNGDHPAESEAVKKADEPADETNGVCKRKADNGAEVVEDEKSPKKAKVVDDGDQAPVEETAA